MRKINFDDVDIMTIGEEPVVLKINEMFVDGVAKRMGWAEKEVIVKDFIQVERDFRTNNWYIRIGPRMLDAIKYMNREGV